MKIGDRLTSAQERMQLALSQLKEAVASSSSLEIIVRSPSFHSSDKQTKNIYFEVASTMNQFFTQLKMDYPKLKLRYMDWSDLIFRWSIDPNRISGDLRFHYGLEIRFLFSQILVHELIKNSSKNKNNLFEYFVETIAHIKGTGVEVYTCI